MHRRLAILWLVAAAGCSGDAPEVEPLDTALLDGDMTAEFEGAAFEPAYGLLYYDAGALPGRLLLSTDPVSCPYVDLRTVAGIHVSIPVSSIDPGTDDGAAHVFWEVTDSSTLDYPYPDGTVEVTDATDETFSGSLDLGGPEASLEGTFEVGRCGG
ncbi:MAG TPA: hypothetical protein VMZ28_17020 [Kofleriaceae bacterium]|nr:hypothetical protein [Kofleriaceae bacterium]